VRSAARISQAPRLTGVISPSWTATLAAALRSPSASHWRTGKHFVGLGDKYDASKVFTRADSSPGVSAWRPHVAHRKGRTDPSIRRPPPKLMAQSSARKISTLEDFRDQLKQISKMDHSKRS